MHLDASADERDKNLFLILWPRRKSSHFQKEIKYDDWLPPCAGGSKKQNLSRMFFEASSEETFMKVVESRSLYFDPGYASLALWLVRVRLGKDIHVVTDNIQHDLVQKSIHYSGY